MQANFLARSRASSKLCIGNIRTRVPATFRVTTSCTHGYRPGSVASQISTAFRSPRSAKPSHEKAPGRAVQTSASTNGQEGMASEVITLGGGCFWCLEACYQQLKGIIRVESGYAAGDIKNPTYQQVCSGTTGHAEVVQVTFDPAVISRQDILRVFFTLHDPTTKDRQGNDVGTQYRSIVLYHNEEQKAAVEEVMAEVVAQQWWVIRWAAPIVTQVQPFDADNYYTAEKYHQNYYAQNPNQGYCQFVVAPKVQKVRAKFMKSLVA